MELIIDLPRARTMARAIRESLGCTHVSASAAYEALARALGHPNWDTLSGLLKQEKAVAPALLPTAPSIQPFLLLVPAYAVSEWGEAPDFAILEVNDQVAEVITRAKESVGNLGLNNLAVDFYEHEWSTALEGYDTLSLRGHALEVGQHSWMLKARPKHTDYDVETRATSHKDFAQLVLGRALPSGFFKFTLTPQEGRLTTLIVQALSAHDEQAYREAWDMAEDYCGRAGRELAAENFSTCDSCGARVPTVIGCPDGTEVCSDCFDSGAH